MDLNSIDITDSGFSLAGFPIANMETEFDKVIPALEFSSGNVDNSFYIYIGISIMFLIIGIFVYMRYANNIIRSGKQRVHFDESNLDCVEGFCNRE